MLSLPARRLIVLSFSARRPSYARARALFSSLSELRNRHKEPARSRLSVLALEDRVYPSITPLGEFAVSSSPNTSQKDPAIASDAAGDFVVVWHAPYPGGGEGIFGQRFDRSGARLGAEFMANQDVWTSYYSPAVAMAHDGKFVIAWHQWDKTDGGVNSFEVFARRYDADGTPLGAEFRVDAVSIGLQYYPAVAMAPDDSFVVAFVDQRDYDGPMMEISARRFDANGNPVGDQLSVNQTPTYNQYSPSIGIDAMGNFDVAWTSEHEDGYANGVYARRYGADGTALSDEFRVNTTWSTDEIAWLGALGVAPTGDFAVVWQGGAVYGDPDCDVYLQRYAADGTPLGGETLINENSTAGRQENATMAVGPDGDFVVAWQSYAGEGSTWEIRAQQFSAEGTRIGDEIRVSEATGVGDVSPRLTIDGNGYATTTFMRQNYAGNSLGPVAQRLGGYSTALLDTGTSTITTSNQGVYESLAVTGTVTAGAPGYEDLYLWRYHVHNNDYSQYWPYGATIFELNLSPGSTDGLSNVKSGLGWGYQIGVPTGASIIRWGGQPLLGPGGEADFSFTTPITAIGLTTAAVEEMFTAAGPLPGPAPMTLTLSVDEYIPVNANHDNWNRNDPSTQWKTMKIKGQDVPQPGIPYRRDFDALDPFPTEDPQLRPLAITWAGNAGSIAVRPYGFGAGSGKLRLWTDAKKTAPYTGTTLQGNSGTVTLYVEGVHESYLTDDTWLRVDYTDTTGKTEINQPRRARCRSPLRPTNFPTTSGRRSGTCCRATGGGAASGRTTGG
jgi:hypothetical protein